MVCKMHTGIGTNGTSTIVVLRLDFLVYCTSHTCIITCPLRIRTPTHGLGFGDDVLIEPSDIIPTASGWVSTTLNVSVSTYLLFQCSSILCCCKCIIWRVHTWTQPILVQDKSKSFYHTVQTYKELAFYIFLDACCCLCLNADVSNSTNRFDFTHTFRSALDSRCASRAGMVSILSLGSSTVWMVAILIETSEYHLFVFSKRLVLIRSCVNLVRRCLFLWTRNLGLWLLVSTTVCQDIVLTYQCSSWWLIWSNASSYFELSWVLSHSFDGVCARSTDFVYSWREPASHLVQIETYNLSTHRFPLSR